MLCSMEGRLSLGSCRESCHLEKVIGLNVLARRGDFGVHKVIDIRNAWFDLLEIFVP